MGEGGTYCLWDGSHRCRHKTSCPLCNLNTLWNILMILGRNVDQDKMICCVQELWRDGGGDICCLFFSKKSFLVFQ